MKDEDRIEIVTLRLENASRTLKEARLLLDNEYWNAAINRMYYACYYAVSALLVKNGLEVQTHSGVRQMLGLHFVKSGKLSVQMANIYSELFSKRQSGDYDDYIFFDRTVTENLYPSALSFIKAIEDLIYKSVPFTSPE